MSEIKRLRPWVRYTLASFLMGTGYITLRATIFKPKTEVVRFDLKKVQELKR